MVKTVNTCCQRYDLKKGTTIIGIITLVMAAISLVTSPLALHVLEEELDRSLRLYGERWTEDQRWNHDASLTVARVGLYGSMAVASLDAVCSALLIYGTRKDKASCVLPWVVEQLVVVPVSFLVSMAYIVICFLMSNRKEGVSSLFQVVIRTAAAVYWIIVVYSRYRQLRGEPVGSNPTSPAEAPAASC